MANIAQGGFRFKRMKAGAKQYAPILLPVASGFGTGIFWGDAVKRLSDGSVAVAAAGDAIVGICCGVERFLGSDGVMRKGGRFLPTGTTYSGGLLGEQCSMIQVIPAEGCLFEVDGNDGTTATTLAAAQALVGENCDLAAGAGGSTITGQSSMVLNLSTHATTNTIVFRIEEVTTRIDADVTATNFKYLVSVNIYQDPPSTRTGT